MSTASEPPVRPTLALLKRLPWAEIDSDMAGAMEELAVLLGEDAFAFDLPSAFAEAAGGRETINLAEMAKTYFTYERRGWDRLSPVLREAMDRGKAIPARDYLAALDWPRILNAALEEVLSRCDAIICPAALGPAPAGLDSTGDPICNGLWTLCGVPAVTVPLFQSSDGLPMGVQLVGRRWDDARLLRTARWLSLRLTQTEDIRE